MTFNKGTASILGTLLVSALMLTGCNNDSNDTAVTEPDIGPVSVASVTFLTHAEIAHGQIFQGSEIGGISGVAYDAEKDLYYAISDDKSNVNPARFYTFKMDLTRGDLVSEDIVIQSVITLFDESGKPYAADTIDAESIAITPSGNLLISSEDDACALITPFVNEYTVAGKFVSALPIDDKFFSNAEGTKGVRDNRAFEGLTITPDHKTVYVSVEDTLQQDGPATGIGQAGVSRFIQYDLATKTVVKEFLYKIEPIEDKEGLAAFYPENTLADILAIDNVGTFLVLERYFDDANVNTNKLYEIKTQGLDQELTDVKGLVSIKDQQGLTYATKRLLYDFNDTGVNKDDFESLVFGPILADGSQSLITVSDNDFQDGYATQFFLFSIQLDKEATHPN